MKKKDFVSFIPATVMLALLLSGCSQDMTQTASAVKPVAEQAEQKTENVFKGPILGKSNKAKTITIQVGAADKAQPVMLRFDENTTGLQFAAKGEAAIIAWEQRGEDKFAVSVKPKLAKLPEGVTEIKVDEMYRLIEENVPMTVVDARPEARFHEAHLPGAINIPVPKLKKLQAEALPADKNELLVFYCGGPT